MTRPTRFSEADVQSILGDKTLVTALTKLYGEKPVFNSAGEMALVHNMDCRRHLLNGLKAMSERSYKTFTEKHAKLVQTFHGWNDKRLPRARRLGAGPAGHGWASVRIAAERRAKEERKAKRQAKKAKSA